MAVDFTTVRDGTMNLHDFAKQFTQHRFALRFR